MKGKLFEVDIYEEALFGLFKRKHSLQTIAEDKKQAYKIFEKDYPDSLFYYIISVSDIRVVK